MIRFTTCSSNPSDGELINAHLLTRDNQVIQGKIEIQDGLITAHAEGHTNYALCLLYDAGESGSLMLQASIIPHR